MIEPKELVEKGICVSFAEARRLLTLPEERLKKIIREKENSQWGRKLRKSRTIWCGNEEYSTVYPSG